MEDPFDPQVTNEILDSQTLPLLKYRVLPESSGANSRKPHGLFNKLIAKYRPYVYIWAAGGIASICGLQYGYQLAIIGGALLQVENEFCFEILQNEVRFLFLVNLYTLLHTTKYHDLDFMSLTIWMIFIM